MKRPKHRIFDYTSRFYKPELDKNERKKRKLGFTRQRKYNSRRKNPIIFFLLALVVLYLILKFSGSF